MFSILFYRVNKDPKDDLRQDEWVYAFQMNHIHCASASIKKIQNDLIQQEGEVSQD